MSRAIPLAGRKSTSRIRTAEDAPGSPFGHKFPFDQMVRDLNKKDSRTQRAAYYLDWAAKVMPKHYQPYNVLLTAVMGYTSRRRMDSDEVKSLRASMTGVRKVLQKKYGRTLDPAGSGVRATTDDEDAASVAMPKALGRLRSAKNSVLAVGGIIDPNKIRDPRIKSYFNRSVRDVIKMVGSEDFDRKLLPPAEKE